MPIIRTDWKKAESVFGTLVDAYQKEIYPYDVAKAPQRKENMPKGLRWGSTQHAVFLFCCCYYMRGGIESDTAINALARLYVNAPQLFSPKYFLRFRRNQDAFDKEAEEIRRLLAVNGLNYNSTQLSKHWIINAVKLQRFWKGNPARLFEGTTSYDDFCGILIRGNKHSMKDRNGFLGFREKMVSMLIHFLMDAGIIDQFIFPVPVDFHILRVLVAQEILVAQGARYGDNILSEEIQAAARDLTHTYCERHSVDPLRLGEALWLLSRTLCRRHPGNGMNVGKRDGRWTILSEIPVIWDRSQVRAFDRSCAFCPLSRCAHNVPSAYYYIQGQLALKGKLRIPHSPGFFNHQGLNPTT